MSTSEQKIEVITEWLQRQAAQRRLTNMLEVQTYAGLRLAEKGYRQSGSIVAVSRDKVFDALAVIAEQSFAADGVLLPAIVVHFSDKKPGRRFFEWANAAGTATETETEDGMEFHGQQVDAVFARYGAPVPDDASSLTG